LLTTAAVIGLVAGSWIITASGFHWPWKPLILFCWWLDCGLQLRQLQRGMRRLAALRLAADGSVRAVDAAGRQAPAALLAGSVVGTRIAWLRVRFVDGGRHAELLLAVHCAPAEWHALQLIWRQSGRFFGQDAGP